MSWVALYFGFCAAILAIGSRCNNVNYDDPWPWFDDPLASIAALVFVAIGFPALAVAWLCGFRNRG